MTDTNKNFDSTYSVGGAIYSKLTGNEVQFDSTYSIAKAIYDGLEDGSISLGGDCPEFTTETLDKLIFRNGDYNYTPTTDGFESVNIMVEVRPETEPLFETITENGTYNYTPTADGYSSVDITVDVQNTPNVNAGDLFSELGYTETDFITPPLNGSNLIEDLQYSLNLAIGYKEGTVKNFSGTMMRYAPNITADKGLMTPNVTLSEMFYACSDLFTVPAINITNNSVDCDSMFSDCQNLRVVNFIDGPIGNATSMFYNCKTLRYLPPKLNTSNCNDMQYMFYGCHNIDTIPALNARSVNNCDNMFTGCINLQNFGGLIGLNANLDLSSCNALTWASLMNVINGLGTLVFYDRELTLGEENISKLTEDEIAIATNKGWIVN